MRYIKVPATTANLGSGLDTLGMALTLFLEVTFTPMPTWSIEISGYGQEVLSRGPDNLIWHTAQALYRTITRDFLPPGRLTIINHIPLGKGLGSSAAAVVAGLLLANSLLPHPLSRHNLLQWANRLEGHADNAASALYGGFTLSWTDTDSLIQVRHYPPPELAVVIAVPPYPVSTPDARKLLPQVVSRQDAVFNAQRMALWIHAVTQKDWSVLRDASADRLHQSYRVELNPQMQHFFDIAQTAGAYAAVLSGSGPAVIALVDPDQSSALSKLWAGTRDVEVIVSEPYRDSAEATESPIHP